MYGTLKVLFALVQSPIAKSWNQNLTIIHCFKLIKPLPSNSVLSTMTHVLPHLSDHFHNNISLEVIYPEDLAEYIISYNS